MRRGAYILFLVFWGLRPQAPAFGQDVLGLIGSGAETKAYAGAGAIASRGPAAILYNPANLIESRGDLEPYAELTIAAFKYSYEYPGYFPIEVDRTAPIPFFGITWRAAPTFWLSFNGLPLPASTGEQEIENFPTRKFTEDPILVNVTTKGKGTGYRVALGAAWKPMSGLGVGLGVGATKGGGSLTAVDVQSGAKIATDESESSSYGFVLGVRASALKGRINSSFVFKPPTASKTKGKTVLHIFEDAEIPKESSGKGPIVVIAGVEGEALWGLAPFAELTHVGWKALREREGQAGLGTAKFDYFDTLHMVFGTSWRSDPHKITVAYGVYQSPLGEGIMASQAPDEVEQIGMEFQNLDAMPHDRYALGYRYELAPFGTYVQGSVSHLSGTREVWEKARGYGDYELTVTMVSAGGGVRF